MKTLTTIGIMLALGAPARADEPAAFAAVEALKTRVVAQPPRYERRAQIGRELKALGPDARDALLALVTAPPAMRDPRTRRMLLEGALEALGELRDPRTAPALRAILDGPEADADVARAAAEALGRLGDSDAAVFLTARAAAGHPRERAALAGLSHCRRSDVADFLGARLDAQPDPASAVAIADAASFLGSSWAWTALGPSRADEGLAIRAHLSAAALRAYPRYSGAAREALGRTLLVLAHPGTPNALAQLRASAEPPLAADLQALERRLLANR